MDRVLPLREERLPPRPTFARPQVTSVEGLRELADQASAAVPASAAAPIQAPVAGGLIEAYTKIVGDIDAYAIQEIDALINRLENLKRAISAENSRAISSFTDFITSTQNIRTQITSAAKAVEGLESTIGQ